MCMVCVHICVCRCMCVCACVFIPLLKCSIQLEFLLRRRQYTVCGLDVFSILQSCGPTGCWMYLLSLFTDSTCLCVSSTHETSVHGDIHLEIVQAGAWSTWNSQGRDQFFSLPLALSSPSLQPEEFLSMIRALAILTNKKTS